MDTTNLFTNLDVVSMRLLDILITEDAEEYPQTASSTVPIILERFASDPGMDARLVSSPRPLCSVRAPFVRAWKARKQRHQVNIEPRSSRFNFMLFIDPHFALNEMRALHTYDALDERLNPKINATAADVNRVLVIQKLLGRERSADRSVERMDFPSRKSICDAYDMIHDPDNSFASPELASSFHWTSLTASMMAGALTMLPVG